MMRTFFTSFLLFSTVLIGFAQAPTVSHLDFLSPGVPWITHVDTVLVIPSDAGPSQTWDYSYLRRVASDTISTIAAFGTPNYAKYPNSTFAFHDPSGDTYSYYSIDAAGIWEYNAIINYSISLPNNRVGRYKFDLAYKPILAFTHLPIHYEDVWTDSSSGTQTLDGAPLYDSVRFGLTTKRVTICDAWGAIKTPSGAFVSSLRVKTTTTNKRKMETLTSGKWSTYYASADTYNTLNWYTPEERSPILEMHQKGKDSKEYYVNFFNRSPVTNLMLDQSSIAKLEIYPNPNKGEFLVKGANELLQMAHTSGQSLPYSAIITPEGVQVHLQGQTPGLYLATIKQGNVINTVKVAITE